jgi:hypothetical protein
MSALRPQLDAGVCQLLAGCLSLQECRRLTGFDPYEPFATDRSCAAQLTARDGNDVVAEVSQQSVKSM